MRVSSQQIFNAGIEAMSQHAADVTKYQAQISSGNRYTRASESPLAAGLAVQVSLDKQQFIMFKANQDFATANLNATDSLLSSINNMLNRVQQLMVQAGNDVLGADGRIAIGVEVQQLRDAIERAAALVGPNNLPVLRHTVASGGTLVDASGLGTRTITGLDNLPTGSDPRTYSGWVQLDSASLLSEGVVVAHGTINPATPYHRSSFFIFPDPSIPNGARLVMDFQVGYVETQALPILDNQWHMVSVSYDRNLPGNGITFYLDGVAVEPLVIGVNGFNKNLVNTINTDNTATFGFEFGFTGGATDTSKSRFELVGLIDDAAIWNRALSSSEIEGLFKDTSSIPSGLVTQQYIEDGFRSSRIEDLTDVLVAPNLTIKPGILYEDVMGLSRPGGVLAEGKTDVLSALNQLSEKLSLGLAPTASDYAAIQSSLTQITRAQVLTGVRANQLEMATAIAEQFDLNVEFERATLLDTDLIQATAGLAKSSALLQAAQAVVSRININALFGKI
jgi:flagellin-like hook-associated protein FlgL